MEPKPHHTRVFSEPDKKLAHNPPTSQLSARRKLVESGLQSDSNSIQVKKRVSSKSSERLQSFSSNSNQASSNPYLRGLILRDFKPVPQVVNRVKSKSPSVNRKNSGSDATFEFGLKIDNARSRKKTEKPTDRIMYIAESFNVKKVTVLVM